VMDCCWTPSR